jgi:hypothetical protein
VSAGDTWFVGSVNGGVWRSKTFNAAVPTWDNGTSNVFSNATCLTNFHKYMFAVLDGQPVTCTSISALKVSAVDTQRVMAGCGGSTSSEQGADWNVMNSGEWGGVMLSADGGDTWKMTGFPANYYVTDMLEIEKGVMMVSGGTGLNLLSPLSSSFFSPSLSSCQPSPTSTTSTTAGSG